MLGLIIIEFGFLVERCGENDTQELLRYIRNRLELPEHSTQKMRDFREAISKSRFSFGTIVFLVFLFLYDLVTTAEKRPSDQVVTSLHMAYLGITSMIDDDNKKNHDRKLINPPNWKLSGKEAPWKLHQKTSNCDKRRSVYDDFKLKSIFQKFFLTLVPFIRGPQKSEDEGLEGLITTWSLQESRMQMANNSFFFETD